MRGRADECGLLERLLADVRRGEGRSLVPRSRVPHAHRRSWVARPGARMEKLGCRCCVAARERRTSVRIGDAFSSFQTMQTRPPLLVLEV